MKIEKLVIYGFGKHEDVEITLGASINVLYGHNEAGKTTIQQFILHILFGFPPKNSPLLRYEPKSGSKYGGQVHIDDAVYGKCIVERVRGKSVGDVVVYFENGEQGEEEALKRLLRQYDRASFESIFSFSLVQLQNFDKMDEQQLSRTLLASGTTGVDHLLQIEAKMTKEMEVLFKKNGRNPVLNQKLQALTLLEEKLQKQRRKMDDYTPIIQRLRDIDAALIQLRERIEVATDDIQRLTLMRQLYPLSVERNAVQTRLQELATGEFPTDGIGRYESIRHQLTEVEAVIYRLQDELKRIDPHLMDEVEEDKRIRLHQFITKESNWYRLLSSSQTVEKDAAELVEKRAKLSQRLGLQTEEEVELLLSADASLRKEEELYELLENLKAYDQELLVIERERERLLGMKEQHHQGAVPTEQDIERAKKWPERQKQLAEAKAYQSFYKQQQQQVKMIGFILGAVTLLLIGYGLAQQQYVFLLIASVLPVIGLFYLKNRMKDAKIAEMEKMIATYRGEEQEMAELVSHVQSYTYALANRKEAQQRHEQDMRQAAETYDQLMLKIAEMETALQRFLAYYGIDGLPSAAIIPELFRMIREIQEVTWQLIERKTTSGELALAIQQQLTEAEELLGQPIPKEALYEWLRKEQQSLTEAAEKQKDQKIKRGELADELQEKQVYGQFLREQIGRLFEEANVKDEGQYYAADANQREEKSLQEQLRNLDLQLVIHGDFDMDLSEADGTLEKKSEALKESVANMKQDEMVLVEEKAKLENEMNGLVTDETYSHIGQQFEVARAEFAELAKVWAAKKALAAAIEQMMDELKEKKLPNVLKEASRLFGKLTNARYEALQLSASGHFEVLSAGGMRFSIVELSQATKEQAYISLRLALANSMISTAPFPIIMDDPLIHFDETRLSHIIEVLEASTAHQFIYFTCHEDMQHRFKHAKTINVSKIGNNEGAI